MDYGPAIPANLVLSDIGLTLVAGNSLALIAEKGHTREMQTGMMQLPFRALRRTLFSCRDKFDPVARLRQPMGGAGV